MSASSTSNREEESKREAHVARLGSEYEIAMAAYCEWRQGKVDPYRFLDNFVHLRKIDICRRRLNSAMSPGDIVTQMRLLENWFRPDESSERFIFETPDGDYRIEQNDVTHYWVAWTPDGEVEGPFDSAQEASDWAAADWEEMFSGS